MTEGERRILALVIAIIPRLVAALVALIIIGLVASIFVAGATVAWGLI